MQHAYTHHSKSPVASRDTKQLVSGARPSVRCSAAAPVGSPIPTSASPNLPKARKQDHVQAQAAFHASIQHLVSVGSRPGIDIRVEEDSVEIARLALLQSSSQRRFARTHLNTVNLSATAADDEVNHSHHLPLSQLAFKALFRASLAAARLNHAYLTTPHIALGLLSAASNSPNSPLAAAAAADRYVAAEAAVTAMIDGPHNQLPAAVGAAVSLSGQSRGIDVVTWCRDMSEPAKRVLQAAEQLRQQYGHDLITSNHLLLALTHDAAGSSSSSSRCQALLSGLGLSSQQIAEQLQQQLQQRSAAAAGEDGVACEPVGFLHEEFYHSISRSLSSSAQSLICLN